MTSKRECLKDPPSVPRVTEPPAPRPPLNRRPGIRVKGEGVEVEDMLMIVISIAGVAGVVGEEGGQSPRVAGEPGEEELERSVERFLRRPRWWIHRADIRYHRGPFVPVSLPS